MMANHTGVVALVLLVVASMASMVVPLQIVPKHNKAGSEVMGGVRFKRIADIKTNGLELPIETPSPKKTESKKRKLLDVTTTEPLEPPTTTEPLKPPTTNPSAVPSFATIANIITFIRKNIEEKKTKEKKKFYIGEGSYKTITSAVETVQQMTALAKRYDEVKVELHGHLEMVLLYVTVIDSKIPKDPLQLKTHVRSHATLEALLIHIFCGKPPKGCEKNTRSEEESCLYFPKGSHKELKKRETTLGDILSRVDDYKKLDHYTQYNDLCVNKDKGAINGATRSKSNNRGILYFAGFDNDA